jgi:hypothetical protein
MDMHKYLVRLTYRLNVEEIIIYAQSEDLAEKSAKECFFCLSANVVGVFINGSVIYKRPQKIDNYFEKDTFYDKK